MTTVFCPYCDSILNLTQGAAIGGLPPTGGDYEWQESDKTYTCFNCKKKFATRVRTSIETGSLLRINNVPKPKNQAIIWYAIGKKEKNFSDVQYVHIGIDALFKTAEEAQEQLAFYQKREHYHQKLVIKVTYQGCFDSEGEIIPEPPYVDYLTYNP